MIRSISDNPNSPEKAAAAHLGLSEFEYKRYKKLGHASQSKVMDLLKERIRLNSFVTQYLEEKINLNKQFGILIQLFFPTEYSLRYALQKVDEIETAVNHHLEHGEVLFDKNTTKKNRLQILVSVADDYKNALHTQLNKNKKHDEKNPIINTLKQKLDDTELLIRELNLQITTSDFHIHNKDILQIKDTDLGYFISKIKTIGVTGFTPKISHKEQPTFLRISIFSALYERFNPNPEKKQNAQEDSNDDDTSTKPNRY